MRCDVCRKKGAAPIRFEGLYYCQTCNPAWALAKGWEIPKDASKHDKEILENCDDLELSQERPQPWEYENYDNYEGRFDDD